MATRQRKRKAPMAEMNVVPYIDVMLVLLVIFMITAPLLAQGVKVELPQAASEPIEREQKDPVIVTVDANGDYYLSVGEGKEKSIDSETLTARVAAVLRQEPTTPILVRGDTNTPYGEVVSLMALLQGAGVPSVGLVTETPPASVGQ
jgi:biopolymer transport protein TolR